MNLALAWSVETVKTSVGVCHKIGPLVPGQSRPHYACIYDDCGHDSAQNKELLACASMIAVVPAICVERDRLVVLNWSLVNALRRAVNHLIMAGTKQSDNAEALAQARAAIAQAVAGGAHE